MLKVYEMPTIKIFLKKQENIICTSLDPDELPIIPAIPGTDPDESPIVPGT